MRRKGSTGDREIRGKSATSRDLPTPPAPRPSKIRSLSAPLSAETPRVRRPVLFHAFLVLLAIVLAAALSPAIFLGCVQASEWIPALRGVPFYRVFSRVLQIGVILALIPAVLSLRVRHPRDVGLEKNPFGVRDLLFGFMLVVILFCGFAALALHLEAYRWRDAPDWGKMGAIVLRAGVVGTLEEIIFRGLLLGLLIKWFERIFNSNKANPAAPWLAAGVSSVVFAAVHFFKPAKIGPAAADVTWLSGFQQLSTVFGADDPQFIIWGFATLFAAGLVLAFAALRTRSLFLPIGIHAGWVLAQQTFNLAARFRVKPPEELLPWIGPNLVHGAVPTGLLPMAVLAVTSACVWIYLRFLRGSCSARPPGSSGTT